MWSSGRQVCWDPARVFWDYEQLCFDSWVLSVAWTSSAEQGDLKCWVSVGRTVATSFQRVMIVSDLQRILDKKFREKDYFLIYEWKCIFRQKKNFLALRPYLEVVRASFWLCTRVTLVKPGYHIGCWVLNPNQPCSRQVPYPLISGPLFLLFKLLKVDFCSQYASALFYHIKFSIITHSAFSHI